jgi:prepilin-type processing-associated H-X9-DG protein
VAAHQSGAFSLVELLVVIAVVALLIALLLPALHQARESGQATLCATRLNQTYLASSAFVTDHRERFPPPVWRADPVLTNQIVWGYPLMGGRYLNPHQESRTYMGLLDVWIGILGCPLDPNVYNWLPTNQLLNRSVPNPYALPGGIPPNEDWGIAYGLNMRYFGTSDWVDLSAIRQPSRMYMIGETQGNIYGLYSSLPDFHAFRHLGAMNMLYADGHIRRLPPADIEQLTFTAEWMGTH